MSRIDPSSAEPLISTAPSGMVEDGENAGGQLWSTEKDRALVAVVATEAAANDGIASFPRVAAALNEMFWQPDLLGLWPRDRAEASDCVPASSLPSSLPLKADTISQPVVHKGGAETVPVPSRLEQVASLATYCAVGPALIFLNRHLLVEKQFKYPACLTASGLLACMITSHVAVFTGNYKLKHCDKVDVSFYMTKIMPIGMGHAGTIITGNIGYLYLSVAFIQILKSFAPVVLVLVLYFAKLEKFNLLLATSMLLITLGSLGAVHGELRFSAFGFWMIILSEFIEAIKLVCQQNLMTGLKFDIVEGLYWMSPAGFFWMVCYSAVMEYSDMASNNAFGILLENWFLFLAVALLGLGVNFVGFWVSKCCSVLTLKIAASARNIGVVCVSTFWLGELLPADEIFWYMVSTGGIALYNFARMRPDVAERVTMSTLISEVSAMKATIRDKDNAGL